MIGRALIVTGLTALACLVFMDSRAQEPDSTHYGIGVVIGNDTIIHRDIREIRVYPRRDFRSAAMQKQYARLIQRVRKVYPYAKTARLLLEKYEPQYATLKTDRQKRKLMNKVEDELMGKYKNDLKKMSITDGRVLIKLIDRETGKTGYTIIKDFRGGLAATFWQGIARIFKNNLKDEYDPYGEDMLIENIVLLLEAGYL